MYFNSATKAVVNCKFGLDKSFQDILFKIDNWINEGSGQIVELTSHINISTYRALSGNCYVKLPGKLRSSKKALIDIKNNNQKYFLRCHVRHINPSKIHPERTTRKDKKLSNGLNYEVSLKPVTPTHRHTDHLPLIHQPTDHLPTDPLTNYN